MTTKVFVSHSAKSQTDKAILEAFVTALSDAGLEPWVDLKRIEIGDAWNDEITKELHDCHGAVVLFSKQALQSNFVKYETSCLSYRKRTQKGFGLYPVIIDDTPVETVTQGFFGAIQFDDYQIGKLDDNRDIILEKLKSLEPAVTTPISTIEGQIFGDFCNVLPELIRDAALELGWEVWNQVDIADAEALHFVRRLLAEPIETQIKALNSIKGALKVNIGKLFEKIVPCWVDEQAAIMLDSARQEALGERCAIVNGTLTNFTCEQFLKRARPLQDSGILGLSKLGTDEEHASSGSDAASTISAQIPMGRRANKDLVVQIRRSLCQRLNVEPQATPEDTDDRIDQVLEKLDRVGRPAVNVLKLNEQQLPLLLELVEHFKRVTFVVLTGETLPKLPPELHGRVKTIHPALNYEPAVVRHNEQYAYGWWSSREIMLGLTN